MRTDLVLIDTSVWIFALRKPPIIEIKEKVDFLLKENRVAICPLIILELLTGVKSKGAFKRLKSRLGALYQIEINQEVWNNAYNLAFYLRQRGLTIPSSDIIIATAAIYNKIPLLHADRHFDLIAENSDLKVESLIKLIEIKKVHTH